MLKKLPTDEPIQVTCKTNSCRYFITKSSKTGLFYLYKELAENNFEKVDKGRPSPVEFNIIVWKRNCC